MTITSAVLVAAAMNPLGLVVIDPPPSLGPEVGARIMESCNRALGIGRCGLAPPPPVPEAPPEAPVDGAPVVATTPESGVVVEQPLAPFRARLRWDGATLEVLLSSSTSTEPLAESTVRFSDADDEKQ